MTDKTLEQEQEQVKSNLGYLLIKAREAANISVESLASQLNLDASQLIDLEKNKYENLGPEIFVKGYIKSYCKILKLNEQEIMQNYQSVRRDPKANEMQSFSNRFEKESHDSRLMMVSYIVLSIVLGSSGILWWQNQSSEDDTAINTPQAGIILNTQSDNINTALVTELKASPTQTQLLPTKDEITAVKARNPVIDLEIAKVNTDNVASESFKEEIAELIPEVVTGKVPAQKEQILQEVILNKIIMRFSGDSWVEIFDATGERVAFGVKKSGYIMTVNGVAPFSVVLGKHHLVEIELDGEKVDTASLPTNRLAKFKIPLSL